MRPAELSAGGSVPARAGPLVLVVEDEPAYAEALEIGLAREGFGVVVATDGAAALERFGQVHPDVVLLDLMLPKISGTDVCRALRRESRTPIIVVTARTSEVDAVVTLELGADDYVTKPFRLRELAARIHAVLRRTDTGAEPSSGDAPPAEALRLAGVELDPDTREVRVDGAPRKLTRKEFDLLAVLMLGAGRVQTRRHLMSEVWGSDYFGDTKTLDVHVKRLRTKLGVAGLITTYRGVGYRFETHPAQPSGTAAGS